MMQDYEDSRLKIEEGVRLLNVPRQSVYRTIDLSVTHERSIVPIRIYQSSPGTDLPVVCYVHGGAWVGGNIETHDNVCRRLSNGVPCVAVSVDYRRPPENKFPAALDDCYAVLKWIFRNLSQMKADIRRLGLAGDSAGGNLVAAMCHKLKAEGLTSRVLLQVLINPALDLRPRSRTYEAYAKYVDWYLNDVQTESKLVYVSPLAAESFQGLPRAFIVTCENDELRTEGEKYGEALVKDGVQASTHELKGRGHLGVLWAAAHLDAEEAMKEVQQAIRQALS
jgi:acetyl esterase